jgi:hypothetical protein
LGVQRVQLGFVAAGKGLVAGRIRLVDPHESTHANADAKAAATAGSGGSAGGGAGAGAGAGGGVGGAGTGDADDGAYPDQYTAKAIPSEIEGLQIISDATICLVVEKEAIFQQLLDSPIPALNRAILARLLCFVHLCFVLLFGHVLEKVAVRAISRLQVGGGL